MDPELRDALNQITQVTAGLRGEVSETREALDRVAVELRDEIRSGDAETREALNQVTAELRGEIRETREALDRVAVELRGEIRSGDAETREALDQAIAGLRGEFGAAVVEMRRHFDVVGESLRGDIRGLAEGMALSIQRTAGRFAESGERTDHLEGRVLKLEVRVSCLEDGRKPGRARRRR